VFAVVGFAIMIHSMLNLDRAVIDIRIIDIWILDMCDIINRRWDGVCHSILFGEGEDDAQKE